jgi:two-component system, cell cycle sensor histidine kinase and response regulator CckA
MDGQAEAIIAEGCVGFMQKPFDLLLLSKRLREILDDRK